MPDLLKPAGKRTPFAVKAVTRHGDVVLITVLAFTFEEALERALAVAGIGVAKEAWMQVVLERGLQRP